MLVPGTTARRWRRAVVLVALLTGARESRAQFISVSGDPSPLIVSAAIAGAPPNAVSDASTTYFILLFNGAGVFSKITGQLSAAMPPGVTLAGTLAAPGGGSTSAGAVTLDVTARNMVTGIGGFVIAVRSITYQLSATLAAGVVATQSRIVTLTVAPFP